jgi:D-xylose transport system substrate-binding protein
MKYTLIAVAWLLMQACTALASEAKTEKADRPIRIGLSFDSLAVERWQKDRDIFVAAAKDLGAECYFLSAEGDARKQNEQCEVLLNKGIDVLVIIPKSATAAARAVKQAHLRSVPVLAYDRLILNCDLDLYISFDNVRVGRMQAEYLTKRHKGRYFLLGGSPDDNNAKLFRQGQVEILTSYVKQKEIEIIGDQWAEGWSPKKAREIVENLLVNVGTDIDVIVASNDGTAGGAIQALKTQGLAGKVAVSGQDADLQACKRILAGTQSMTVYKPLKALATKAAELSVHLARGKAIETQQSLHNGKLEVPAILLSPITLDKGNLVDVLTRDGYYTREALLE